jgi:hypothetical protein
MRVVQTLMAAQVITARNGNGNAGAQRRETAVADDKEVNFTPAAPPSSQPIRPAIPVRKS